MTDSVYPCTEAAGLFFSFIFIEVHDCMFLDIVGFFPLSLFDLGVGYSGSFFSFFFSNHCY